MTLTAELGRIGICDVFSALAHDYGLYGIAARLDRMGYRPSPFIGVGGTRGLDESQYAVYRSLEARALRTDPYAKRLAT